MERVVKSTCNVEHSGVGEDGDDGVAETCGLRVVIKGADLGIN